MGLLSTVVVATTVDNDSTTMTRVTNSVVVTVPKSNGRPPLAESVMVINVGACADDVDDERNGEMFGALKAWGCS